MIFNYYVNNKLKFAELRASFVSLFPSWLLCPVVQDFLVPGKAGMEPWLWLPRDFFLSDAVETNSKFRILASLTHGKCISPTLPGSTDRTYH